MYYQGKFRDFLTGWLALQLEEPAAIREEVETLYYDAVVYAENDGVAMARVEEALGDWAARMLWGLSERWYNTTVEMVRGIIEALRGYAQECLGDLAEFYLFFLNPLEGSGVPDDFREICWMFRVLYSTAGETVLAPIGWEPYVVVEPSYEGASDILVLAHPKGDSYAKVFVLQDWYKAWHLRFPSLEELARELLGLRQAIERCATQAILHYRLAKTVTEVMGSGKSLDKYERYLEEF